MDYLLDTNIVLIYTRESNFTHLLENDLQLFTSNNNLAISIVTVGEIKSLAKQLRFGEKKLKNLERLLNRLAIIDINILDILERYAEIDAYSQGKLLEKQSEFTSRNMGKTIFGLLLPVAYML